MPSVARSCADAGVDVRRLVDRPRSASDPRRPLPPPLLRRLDDTFSRLTLDPGVEGADAERRPGAVDPARATMRVPSRTRSPTTALDFDDLVARALARASGRRAAARAVARTLLDAARRRGPGPRSHRSWSWRCCCWRTGARHLPRGRRRPDDLCVAARRRAADPRPRGALPGLRRVDLDDQLPLPAGGRRARRPAGRARSGAVRQGASAPAPAARGRLVLRAGSRRRRGACPPVARRVVRHARKAVTRSSHGPTPSSHRSPRWRSSEASRTRRPRTGCSSATTRVETRSGETAATEGWQTVPRRSRCAPPGHATGSPPTCGSPWLWAAGLAALAALPDSVERAARAQSGAAPRRCAAGARDHAHHQGPRVRPCCRHWPRRRALPSDRTLSEAEDRNRALEEERRLAYVAWTRARRSLLLVFDPAAPSTFLREAFDDVELAA